MLILFKQYLNDRKISFTFCFVKFVNFIAQKKFCGKTIIEIVFTVSTFAQNNLIFKEFSGQIIKYKCAYGRYL